jgi:hypothetical protein
MQSQFVLDKINVALPSCNARIPWEETMPHLDTPQSRCRCGVARRDITPPVGIYHRTWGAATHDRATGVHRPLTATALALESEDGTDTQVIVAVDLCLLLAGEMSELLDSVSRRAGIRPEQITIAFSHTHSTGLMSRDRLGQPGGELIQSYLEKLGRQTGDAVVAALESSQAANISYGMGRCSLAANRDFWDASSNQFVCGFNPEQPADDTLLVARINDYAGRIRVAVVNYACHPTTLAWQNTLLSPDFPAAMREVVENATGAPCVFLQGASGELGPREGYVGDPAVADRNGRQLGFAALATLESLPPTGTRFVYAGPVVSGATLGTWEHRPLDAQTIERQSVWAMLRTQVELTYRPDRPTMDEARQELARWQREEAVALQASNSQRARDCRAMAERTTRWLGRLPHLPKGDTFPLPIVLWRVGDAVWLAVECEHYSLLQCRLRERFAGSPVVVITLANGSRATYLPTADAYGKGIYQESIAVLAGGSLEHLIERLTVKVAELLMAKKLET